MLFVTFHLVWPLMRFYNTSPASLWIVFFGHGPYLTLNYLYIIFLLTPLVNTLPQGTSFTFETLYSKNCYKSLSLGACNFFRKKTIKSSVSSLPLVRMHCFSFVERSSFSSSALKVTLSATVSWLPPGNLLSHWPSRWNHHRLVQQPAGRSQI